MAESVASVLCEKLLKTESVPAEILELHSSSEWLGHGDNELFFFLQSLFSPLRWFLGARFCRLHNRVVF